MSDVRTQQRASGEADLTGIDPNTWLSPPEEPFDPCPGQDEAWVRRITVDERVLHEDD